MMMHPAWILILGSIELASFEDSGMLRELQESSITLLMQQNHGMIVG